MDFTIMAVILGIAALALGYAIYRIMIRLFQSESAPTFIYALLALIVSDFMIVFLMVICIFKATGIA